jgi:CRP-like cAMP-binding protein
MLIPLSSRRWPLLQRGSTVQSAKKGRTYMTHLGIHSPNSLNSCDIAHFLACAGVGRRIVHYNPKDALFSQGDLADSVFYLQSGRFKVTVVSETGKEATISILSAGDFIGEDSLAGAAEHRSVEL